MNTDRHIENIIAQTSGMIMEHVKGCINADGILKKRDIEKFIALAVKCGFGIGYNKAFERESSIVYVGRPIFRMDARMEVKEVYPSVKKASEDVQVSRKAIQEAVKHGWFAGGYKWKYA